MRRAAILRRRAALVARMEDEGELALVGRIKAGAAGHRSRFVGLGIGDDCAILRPAAGTEIVVTTDFTLEGRHFRREWHSAESVGHRCLARGLSDVAAMGARPMAAFLSLALPRETPRVWVDSFLRGLLRLAGEHGVVLAGGDTAEAAGSGILADVVLVGSVAKGGALRRSGARVGEMLYVTGTLGGAAAELERLRAGSGRLARRGVAGSHPQLYPEARVAAGRALVRRGLATACMDLSDGLSTDLGHLCRASGVGAEIRAEALPAAQGATVRQALDGGEDYELLFAAKDGAKVPKTLGGVAITAIGRVVDAAEGVTLLGAGGTRRALVAAGWEHFRSGVS